MIKMRGKMKGKTNESNQAITATSELFKELTDDPLATILVHVDNQAGDQKTYSVKR